MTNTETCMREMRCLISMFKNRQNFDEQWIFFKAYLNTAHSLQDNDSHIKTYFFNNELLNFILVLRNIIHHQPAKFHFGKHSVFPTGFSFGFSQETGGEFQGNLGLVIEKKTLESKEVQDALGSISQKQLKVLKETLVKINMHVIFALSIIEQSQVYIESYCKKNNKYTERYDNQPSGYILTKNV